MILTQQDIDAFEQVYREFEREQCLVDPFAEDLQNFIESHPQVYMCAGFQEFIGAHRPQYAALVRSEKLSEMARPIFRDYRGDWIQIATVFDTPGQKWHGYSVDAFVNAEKQLGLDGWKDMEFDFDEDEEFNRRISRLLTDSIVELPSFDDIIMSATQLIENPLADPTSFVSPQLWTPKNQIREKEVLQSSAIDIICALQNEELELSEIHWRRFEELVAEVLRADGLEIHLVKENPQGGRDIIARTNFGSGEVLTMAIEVKHRDVVDRPMVQTALQQNKMFPALMFVTSGRFSTGVFREAKKPENRMRLFLRDGVAIGNLIQRYPLAQGEQLTRTSTGRARRV